jgi:hypothetical protein
MKQQLARFSTIESPLLGFARNVTSQCGEDGIIERILDTLQPANRYCVEFGAWDGKRFSNCFNLLKHKSWSGLMIEANAEKYRELQKTYQDLPQVTALNRFVAFEGADTLDQILRENGAPQELGVLSIDIDGNDYYVWESLQAHSADLVIVEFNPTIPNDVIFVQEKSFQVNHGCSLLALVLLGKEKGYELACCTSWNAFFVKRAAYPSLGIKDNFIYKMYQPLQDGRIFQGYDSSIHVVGMDNLIWGGGVRLASADFQVVPESMRHWGDAQKRDA